MLFGHPMEKPPLSVRYSLYFRNRLSIWHDSINKSPEASSLAIAVAKLLFLHGQPNTDIAHSKNALLEDWNVLMLRHDKKKNISSSCKSILRYTTVHQVNTYEASARVLDGFLKSIFSKTKPYWKKFYSSFSIHFLMKNHTLLAGITFCGTPCTCLFRSVRVHFRL